MQDQDFLLRNLCNLRMNSFLSFRLVQNFHAVAGL
jgi:hypothetical protein